MKKLEEKRYWVWLSLIPNLGSRKKQTLLKQYKSPKIIYHLKEEELLKVEGMGEKTIKKIQDEKIKSSGENHIISIFDK